ncbi:MAG: response regulator [Tenuifilaceae bacterium]|jgi:CheY-like chemotaxis protein|nr:response regulator [Tenuifilaceae bacterium]
MTLSSYKILIVDDNKTFAETLSLLVRSTLGDRLSGIEMASNGKEAVEMALNDQYDIIFMDVHMPEMDGIEATQIINRKMYRDTRIFAVSFEKDFNTITRMITSGAENYLHKDTLTIESLERIFNINPLQAN